MTYIYSGNLGASTSWNPQALSRHVMGLLYFYHIYSEQVETGQSKKERTKKRKVKNADRLLLLIPKPPLNYGTLMKHVFFFALIKLNYKMPLDPHQQQHVSIYLLMHHLLR